MVNHEIDSIIYTVMCIIIISALIQGNILGCYFIQHFRWKMCLSITN